MRYDYLMTANPETLAHTALASESFGIETRLACFECLYARVEEIGRDWSGYSLDGRVKILAALALDMSGDGFVSAAA